MTRLFKIFWQAVLKLTHDGGLAIASNIALSLLLSLFPFLMLIAVIVGKWGDQALLEQVLEIVFSHWPAGSAAPIAEQINIVLAQGTGEFFSIGTVIALVLATNGVESARDGLNRAYRLTETRSFIRRRLQSALFVLVGALGLIGAAFILVGTPVIWNFLVLRAEWLAQFSFTVTLVQYGIAAGILVLTLYSFHYFLPDGKQRPGILVWGILVTILGIFIGSRLFALYLQTIANYTALYAGLAGMMIAIVYLYCLSVLILFGAEFNAALSENTKQGKQA